MDENVDARLQADEEITKLRKMDTNVIARFYANPRGYRPLNDAILSSWGAVKGRRPAGAARKARGTTPKEDVSCIGDDEQTYDDQPYIELRLDKPPKTSLGVVFGHRSSCDVVLPADSNSSGKQFCVTFNADLCLVVRDMHSTNGTQVSYTNEGGEKKKNGFQWIISGHDIIVNTDIVITFATGYSFRVFVNNSASRAHSYKMMVQQFCRSRNPIGEMVENLAVESQAGTRIASCVYTPKPGAIQLRRALSRGTFGCVTRIWDVSTGISTAVKEPRNSTFRRNKWLMEIEIMRGLSHENIVPLLGAEIDPKPKLYLPYYQNGSLRQNMQQLTIDDKLELLKQCLAGLAYAHEQCIAHRDIKPENILVETLSPFKIRIADFCEAKDEALLKSFCGTAQYMAPEVFHGRYTTDFYYTKRVDIWSVGALSSETFFGRPAWPEDEEINADYCDKLVAQVLSHCATCPDRLKRFLLVSLLKEDPETRASAKECHSVAMSLSAAHQTHVEVIFRTTPLPDSFLDDLSTNSTQQTTSTVLKKVTTVKPQPRTENHRSYYGRIIKAAIDKASSYTAKRCREDDLHEDSQPPERKRRLTATTPSKTENTEPLQGTQSTTQAVDALPEPKSPTGQSDDAVLLPLATVSSSNSVYQSLLNQLSGAESVREHALQASKKSSPAQNFIKTFSPVLQSIEWPLQDGSGS